MAEPAQPQSAKRSEARERLLDAASAIFYAEGINNVGVQRIVSAGSVTLATFYRHFPSKDDLAVAYLKKVHDQIRERAGVLGADARGRDLVRAMGGDVSTDLSRPDFRGCAFINAASEFEDPESPIRQVVAEHRDWHYDVMRSAFADAGHELPGNAARHYLMLRDGAMVAGYLGNTTTAKRTFARGVEGLLRSIDVEALNSGEPGSD